MIHTRITFDTPIPPTWLVGRCRSGIEPKMRDRFKNEGIPAFFPNYYRTFKRHDGRTWQAERADVTGYVFCKFRALPNGEWLRERFPGFYGFEYSNGSYVQICRADIERLNGMTVEEERLRKERLDMLRVREGDIARKIAGALGGMEFRVDELDGSFAKVDWNGKKMRLRIEDLERISQ